MLNCEIFHDIANLSIGFFSFILAHALKILVLIPIYVFIQRIHNQTQQRSLKAITDEITKVNDFIIEFTVKFNQIKPYKDIDEKTIVELMVLKSKINSHINYLNEYILAFPYGGPINYLIFFITKKYMFESQKRLSEEYEIEYQELILNDTILSLEKDFINSHNQLVSLNSQTNIIDLTTIDKIISTSTILIAHFEGNTRKMI